MIYCLLLSEQINFLLNDLLSQKKEEWNYNFFFSSEKKRRKSRFSGGVENAFCGDNKRLKKAIHFNVY